ncbi:unnamed protein product [Arabis nemorensis]|uniref:Uncharacterized protein n=1 Tax=Arabis nemorensis TaxID=586526 RepID=A0A565BJP5_9BRAS|nr:unnamed protein product [Arabis nemorensis]
MGRSGNFRAKTSREIFKMDGGRVDGDESSAEKQRRPTLGMVPERRRKKWENLKKVTRNSHRKAWRRSPEKEESRRQMLV